MFVSCHTALQVAAAAQALHTLAAAARSLRGRWRKMSASTSSGSCSPGSAIAWCGVGAPLLPEALVWNEREVPRFRKARVLRGTPEPIYGNACGPGAAT